MAKRFSLLFSLCLLCWLATASAALRIEINKGVTAAVPIAVVPFAVQGNGNVPLDVAGIVARDLKASGSFSPLARSKMLAQPSLPKQVDYKNWREVAVDDLVIGQVSATASGYSVTFHLLDVYGGSQLAGYTIKVGPHGLRRAAHHVADLIYEKLTGETGPFESRIAFVSVNRADKQYPYRIEVASWDGHDVHTVVRSKGALMSPTWSPGGKRLAFVAFHQGHSIVYVQNLRTGKLRKVADHPGINSAPAWSPNGQDLAMSLSFPGNAEIYVLNLQSGHLRRLTHSPAIDTEPSWLPDGKKLVFTSDRGGRPQIYEIGADGGSATRLTYNGKSNADGEISPDGKSLLMVHQDNKGYTIAVMDLKTHTLTTLTPGPLDESPSYSPGGAMIVYSPATPKGRGLAIISADGQVRESITLPGEAQEPSWSPSEASP